MRNRLLISTALLHLLISGCSRYHPMPLSTSAVEAQLTPPTTDALRTSAANLRHPILKPVQIDPNQPLSPEEAAVIAVIANPDLRAERARRAIADAQLLQAGILPNPQLTANIDFPHGADAADSFTQYGVGANWDVTSLIGRNLRRRAASEEAQSVALDVAWKEWQIAEAAKTAALDILALEARVKAAREMDDQQLHNVELVRRAVSAYNKTVVELSAAESSAQDSRAALLSEEKDLRHAYLVLNRSLGLPPDAHIAVRGSGEGNSLPSRFDPPPADELRKNLEHNRLDLLALKLGYESQDATLRAAILGQFPKINLGFNVARDTSNVHTVGLGVGIDIPIFDRNQGVIANENATRQKLFDEYVSRVYTARSDIAAALDDIHSVNGQIGAAEAALPSLEKLVQTYRAAMERGNADILSYYSAVNTLAQKRIDLMKLKQQLMENRIALEIASGQYLGQSRTDDSAPATTKETQ